MEATVGTILVVLLFVVPGYLLRSGYLRSRARTSPEIDMYGFAEAIVGSLFVIAALWFWRGSDVLGWTEAHTLSKHEGRAFWFFVVLFAAPFWVGLLSGWAVDAITLWLESKRREAKGWRARGFAFLQHSGLIRHPTVWDDAWLRARAEKRIWVRIFTVSGDQIIGIFADESRVGTSPTPRQVYLEYVEHLREDGSMAPVPGGKGIYIDAQHIAAVEFAAIAATEDNADS
jgi:hypothetical protein